MEILNKTLTEILMASEISTYISQIRGILVNYASTQLSKTKDVLILFLDQIRDWDEILTTVKENKLSRNLIDIRQLKKLLDNIEGKLQNTFTLSIDSKDLNLYYRIPLTSYQIENQNGTDYLYIQMMIPLRSSKSEPFHHLYSPQASAFPCLNDFCILNGQRYPERFQKFEQDSEQIRATLKQFSHLFAIDLSQLKRAKGIYHYIETGDALPVHTKPYRTSAEEKKIIKEEIEKMLEYNIITKSKSSWSSGICLVTKSDNTIRFCIDFRRLNDVTIKEKIPIPIISDIYDALVGNNYFTVLDCKMGYWSIPLHPETKHKTAFTSYLGLYEWNVMPFGLSNAPGSFQSYLQNILGSMFYKNALVFIDDIIIYS